ncbi:hypothetical protein [Priestia koreensis]|uniref:hypothetical protein n=1 Tax=Priestia koreensis TaxID=284581 RepID=UPI001F57A39B|nr:hypothetical protein [Priestia koreensis]MCM3006308.1 hypothetical protein [Priestia koreensis]UNL82938.1 hypothetical protein IE339_12040 [Priestia koreensis]
MILSHQLSVEQKSYVKQLKEKIADTRSTEEKKLLQQQLNAYIERIFIEHRIQRQKELT